MNEKTIQYPFNDHVYFCSEEKYGRCFLTMGKKLIIQKDETYKDYILPDSFDEAYTISERMVLLILNSPKEEALEDHFRFSVMIFDLEAMQIIKTKYHSSSDLRGLFIDHEKSEIVLAYHKYFFGENRSIDPVELFEVPPLQSQITSSYVVTLDFDLKEKCHLCFCDNPPDDLILSLSRLNDSSIVIDFNSGARETLKGQDITKNNLSLRKFPLYRAIGEAGGAFYLYGMLGILKINPDGKEETILEIKEIVTGVSFKEKGGFPEIEVFFKNKKIVLSTPSSIRMIYDL